MRRYSGAVRTDNATAAMAPNAHSAMRTSCAGPKHSGPWHTGWRGGGGAPGGAPGVAPGGEEDALPCF